MGRDRVVLADEFREGNVYTGRGIKEIIDEVYDILPPGTWQVRVRSDSAAYQQGVLEHWQGRGWQFAVSTDMSRGLRQEIDALPEEALKVWKKEEMRGTVEKGRKYLVCLPANMRGEIASLIDIW